MLNDAQIATEYRKATKRWLTIELLAVKNGCEEDEIRAALMRQGYTCLPPKKKPGPIDTRASLDPESYWMTTDEIGMYMSRMSGSQTAREQVVAEMNGCTPREIRAVIMPQQAKEPEVSGPILFPWSGQFKKAPRNRNVNDKELLKFYEAGYTDLQLARATGTPRHIIPMWRRSRKLKPNP